MRFRPRTSQLTDYFLSSNTADYTSKTFRDVRRYHHLEILLTNFVRD